MRKGIRGFSFLKNWKSCLGNLSPTLIFHRISQNGKENRANIQSNLSTFKKWIKPTSRWQMFVLIITILAFIFSIISLVITVIALNLSPFFWETVASTNQIFSDLGLFQGALLISVGHFLTILIIPFLLWLIFKLTFSDENGESVITISFRFILLALIEAFASSNFITFFLGMSNDALVLSLNYAPLTMGQGSLILGTPIPFEFISSAGYILMLLTFLCSLLFRAGRHLGRKKGIKPRFHVKKEIRLFVRALFW